MWPRKLCGAFVASAVLYFVFGDALRVFEQEHGIVRGQAGSEASAMVFGEFYPNPCGRPLTPEARLRMLPAAAFGAEVIATAVSAAGDLLRDRRAEQGAAPGPDCGDHRPDGDALDFAGGAPDDGVL